MVEGPLRQRCAPPPLLESQGTMLGSFLLLLLAQLGEFLENHVALQA